MSRLRLDRASSASSRECSTGTCSSPSACSSEDRHLELGDRVVLVVLREEGVQGALVGREREPALGQPATQGLRARRADGYDRRGGDRAGGHEREIAAHARASQRDRRLGVAETGAKQRGDRADVIEHAPVERAIAIAVSALVEGDRGQAGAECRSGEVVVVLLARPGAVQHDHTTARRRRG